jgi:hypothetical protein
MRRTYHEATAVLLIDNYMARRPTENLSALQKLLLLYCSPWATRLWTLQEGFLAQKLFIQYGDKSVPFKNPGIFDELSRSVKDRFELTGGLNIFLSQYSILKTPETSENPYLLSIAHVQHYLINRQTSCPEDEALCLGVLVGIDIEDLFAGDAADRMQRFWRSKELNIPSELIIYRLGPRISVHGLRWAPKSFMARGNDNLVGLRMPLDQLNCKLDENGLHVQYPGVILSDWIDRPFLPRRLWLQISGSEPPLKFFVHQQYWLYRESPSTFIVGNHLRQESFVIRSSADSSQSPQFALLMRARPKYPSNSEEGEIEAIHTALVYVYTQQNGVNYSQLVSNGMMFPEAEGRALFGEQQEELVWIAAEQKEIRHPQSVRDTFMVEPDFSNELRQWCIG